MNDEPYYDLIAAFWRCLRADLEGRGVVAFDDMSNQRSQPAVKWVTIEREVLQEKAQEFLTESDFNWWAIIAGFDAQEMRTRCQSLIP